MLFFRFHAPHNRDSTEAASRPRHTRPHREQYEGWLVEVTHRRVGVTVRRDQYRAMVRRPEVGQEHLLTGFSSLSSALDAARRWIDGQQTRRRLVAQRLRARMRARRRGGPGSS
jgi:hypothetical protein